VPWPGLQAGVTQPVQQVVNPLQRVGRAELLAENPLKVTPPQRTDAVRRARARLQPGAERGLRGAGQLGRLAGTRPLVQGLQAAIPVAVDPVLNKAPAAAQLPGDLRRRTATHRQQHRP